MSAEEAVFLAYVKYESPQSRLISDCTESETDYCSHKLLHWEYFDEFLELFEASKAIFRTGHHECPIQGGEWFSGCRVYSGRLNEVSVEPNKCVKETSGERMGNSVSSKSSENGQERELACTISRANGEVTAGTGTSFTGCLLVEVAGPWGYDVGESRRFPEGLWEALKGLWEAGIIEKFTAIMPDPDEYSREGYSRAILLRRPKDLFFASYQKEDYLMPEDELVPLIKALLKPEGTSRFARYREDTSRVRDILVCTHGSHDVCCGRFGYPLYEELRREYAAASEVRLRVWRTSHLGGHRFAPNLIDLPEGRYWGRMGSEDLENFVTRNGAASDLRGFYRGWAGLSGKFEQIAEGEALAREGWGWTEYPKAGEVVEVDEDEERAKVRIKYRTLDGASGVYEATVELAGSVETLLDSGTEELQEVRQYSISRFEKANCLQ